MIEAHLPLSRRSAPVGFTPFWDLLGLAAALGGLLGISTMDAGYVMGGILVVSFLVIGLILESALEGSNPAPFFGILGTGLVLARLFGWWPDWALLLAVIFLLFSGLGFLRRD